MSFLLLLVLALAIGTNTALKCVQQPNLDELSKVVEKLEEHYYQGDHAFEEYIADYKEAFQSRIQVNCAAGCLQTSGCKIEIAANLTKEQALVVGDSFNILEFRACLGSEEGNSCETIEDCAVCNTCNDRDLCNEGIIPPPNPKPSVPPAPQPGPTPSNTDNPSNAAGSSLVSGLIQAIAFAIIGVFGRH